MRMCDSVLMDKSFVFSLESTSTTKQTRQVDDIRSASGRSRPVPTQVPTFHGHAQRWKHWHSGFAFWETWKHCRNPPFFAHCHRMLLTHCLRCNNMYTNSERSYCFYAFVMVHESASHDSSPTRCFDLGVSGHTVRGESNDCEENSKELHCGLG